MRSLPPVVTVNEMTGKPMRRRTLLETFEEGHLLLRAAARLRQADVDGAVERARLADLRVRVRRGGDGERRAVLDALAPERLIDTLDDAACTGGRCTREQHDELGGID